MWHLDLNGLSSKIKENRRKFALFYAKTLDRIADPRLQNEPAPEELFEIGPLLAEKLPKSNWYDLTKESNPTFINV